MNSEKKREIYYNKWKRKAMKRRIENLFIAESPPKDYKKYIYFDKGKYNKNEMTYHLFKALIYKNSDKKNLDKKEVGLKEFTEKYFLMDAIENPIFKNGKLRNKTKQIRDNKERILKEIEELNPQKIVIIGCGVYDVLYDLLEKDKRLIKKKIPFPSHGHQKKFNKKIKNII